LSLVLLLFIDFIGQVLDDLLAIRTFMPLGSEKEENKS